MIRCWKAPCGTSLQTFQIFTSGKDHGIYGYEIKLTREGVEVFVPSAVAGKAQLLYSPGTSFPPHARESVNARARARRIEKETYTNMTARIHTHCTHTINAYVAIYEPEHTRTCYVHVYAKLESCPSQRWRNSGTRLEPFKFQLFFKKKSISFYNK